MPASSFSQGTFKYERAITDAKTVLKIRAIWEGPDVTSSPNIFTPANIIAISASTGINEIKSPGFFIIVIYMPLKLTDSKASVGMSHLLVPLGSVPAATKLFHNVIRLPVIFISLTG